MQLKLKFNAKDQNSKDLTDFQVYIDGKIKDDKNTYTFGSKVKYVVKKLGYADSTEMEHTVEDAEPNEISVTLERIQKVSVFKVCVTQPYLICLRNSLQ